MAAIAAACRSFPRTGLPDVAIGAGTRNVLLDRTPWPRLGLRGPGTRAWCDTRSLPFPEQVNRVAGADGLRVIRLGRYELLILPDEGASRMPRTDFEVPGIFDGYRDETWSWLRMEGPEVFEALSALTAVDLRPDQAPVDSVAQTRAAGLDAVLVIAGREPAPAVDIFVDVASVEYFLGAIMDRCPQFAS